MDWTLTLIWIGVMLVLLFIEAITPQLVTIWFALGALVSLIAHLLHAPLILQLILFVLVSVVSLVLTRPLAKKHLKQIKTPTNADRVIGCTGIVQSDINNDNASGTVAVNGTLWSARSESGEMIPAKSKVIVQRIEGVKLIVKSEN